MAEIPMSGGPYAGKGPGFNGPPPGAYAHDVPYHKRPVHSCINFLLRVLTALATAAAFITMIRATETVRVGGVAAGQAKWNSFGSFKWFVLANIIVCIYAIVAAGVACLSLCARRGPLSYTPTAWATFIVDFLLANALMSAAAAALAVAWIGHKGQPTAGWAATCPMVKGFCDRVEGALIASFLGWIFLALSTLLAVSSLNHLAMRRN